VYRTKKRRQVTVVDAVRGIDLTVAALTRSVSPGRRACSRAA
jgi:hypothetical protein